MLLSEKRTTFSGSFIACLQYTQNSVDFLKKDQLHRLNISAVLDPEKCGYFNARELLF